MSTRERLIVAAVSALAIAMGGGYIWMTSKAPSAEGGTAEAAPAVNPPPPSEPRADT